MVEFDVVIVNEWEKTLEGVGGSRPRMWASVHNLVHELFRSL